MKKKDPRGRKSFEGTYHTWKVPSDIEAIYQRKGVTYIWDAIRNFYRMDNMKERFTLTALPDMEWRVTDNHNSITLEFIEGLFNDTQKVNTENYKGNPLEVATIMREIGEWVSSNYNYLAVCNETARASVINKLSTEVWFEIVSAFNGHLYDNITPPSFALTAEVEDHVNMSHGDKDIITTLKELSEEEKIEAYNIVRAFWTRNAQFVVWVDNLKTWAQSIDDCENSAQLENDITTICVNCIKSWKEENWYKKLDINEGCYIDFICHYDEKVSTLIDCYLELHSLCSDPESPEDYDSEANEFFARLEKMLHEINIEK